MAIAPSYAATPLSGAALLGAAETSLSVPTTTSIIATVDATNGGKIEQVRICPIATVVAGLVYLFLYDGSLYHLQEAVTIVAGTVSATNQPVYVDRFYDNMILKGGWSLRASQSIAGNASLIKVSAFGGSY